jgi:hypothetical protein
MVCLPEELLRLRNDERIGGVGIAGCFCLFVHFVNLGLFVLFAARVSLFVMRHAAACNRDVKHVRDRHGLMHPGDEKARV